MNIHVIEKEIADWLSLGAIPKQLNLYNGFGQPPVTLFNNDHFAIDLYFWMDADTSIHDHSFSGAFKILQGRSLHEQYEIEKDRLWDEDIAQVKLNRVKSHIVGEGTIHKITRGPSFCHRLVHLDSPTVTLCLRTVNDRERKQWHYFNNGMAIEKKELTEDVVKSLYYFQYYFDRDLAQSQVYLEQLLERWSSSMILNLYEKVCVDELQLYPFVNEYLLETIEKKLQQHQWFQSYLSYYQELQENYIAYEEEGPVARLMEFVANAHYTFEEAHGLVREVKRTELMENEVLFLKECCL